MSLKYLPTSDDWEAAIRTFKLKDNGLSRALDDFWSRRDDEFDKPLALLPKIQKLATDLKKAKEVVAAGPKAVKYLGDLIAVIPVVRKDIEDRKKEYSKAGMEPVDVQIMIVDWNGKPVSSDYVALVQFTSPGTPDVTNLVKIKSTGVDLDNLKLRSSGSLYLVVREGSSIQPYIEGTTDYEVKKGKAVMKFKAIQHSKPFKMRAKSLEELSKRVGVKGEVGVEFAVFKVGGEVSSESEYKKGYEHEVEWEGEAGLPTFKDFKQL